MDVAHTRLVRRHQARSPGRAGQGLAPGDRGLCSGDAQRLAAQLDRSHPIDLDGRPLRFVGVDGLIVHPHRVLRRHGRGDRGVHRIAEKQDLAFRGSRRRGGFGRRRLRGGAGLQRHETHAADRAVALLVGDVVRMHRAVILCRRPALVLAAAAGQAEPGHQQQNDERQQDKRGF